ncbi:ribose-phosphate diphosphokinase [Chryseolinea sp. H1M3-3]|uniref:ribose-phosphate diphosphokinase n=1 Tax=Chryseolinea sp. H1M3-3 TaxID=3034144 RepID=UPI0023EC5F8D|nr:ribose-phosphate diphosphokinase [Chryseolinea sp. H1M3-3]
MSRLLISFPGNELMTDKIGAALKIERAAITIRNFPDGESYVRVLTDVNGKEIIVVAALDRPDTKFLALVFLLRLLRDSGAKKITLVSPYLAYMRQDKQFQPGEAVTSTYFAAFLSACIDELITIDPHLHRRSSMAEIYAVPCHALHAAPLISEWIRASVPLPVLIGPDSESEQWVSIVAKNANAPYLVLEKQRYGDRSVSVSFPDVAPFRSHTPVLVDDIISTARTMIAAVKHLREANMRRPFA